MLCLGCSLPSKGPKFQKSAAPGLVLLEREETAQKFVSVAAPTPRPRCILLHPTPAVLGSHGSRSIALASRHGHCVQHLGFAASGTDFAEGLVQAGEGVWRDVQKGLAEQNPHRVRGI